MRKGSIRRGLLALLAAAAVAPLLAGCATIAEQRKLARRIDDLESGSGAPGTPGRDRLADLAARMDSLDTQIGQLQGRLEVAEHRVDEALSEARAARAEAAQKGGTAGATPAAPSAAAPGADEPAGAEVSAELKAYREARNAWSQGNADACIDRFRSFLQTYPSSTYAESASYWMADCFYKRGDYKIAVLRFDEVVARFPKGERAPDALYRQGEALLKLGPGYGKAAEKAFERVIQEYPTSDRAVEAKKQLQLLGSG